MASNSSHWNKKQKAIISKAHKGQNAFGGNFAKVAAAGAKEYGSAAAGKRVSAAIYWKKVRKVK